MGMDIKAFGTFDPEPGPDSHGHLYQLLGNRVSCTCGWGKTVSGWKRKLAYREFELHEKEALETARWDALSDEALLKAESDAEA